MTGKKLSGRRFRNTILRGYVATLIDILSWRVAFASGLMVLVSLTEGLGLLLLLPLMQLVGLNVEQGSAGRLSVLVLSTLTLIGVPPTLIAVLAIFVLVTAVQALMYRWQTMFNLGLVQEFVTSLRQRLYRAITNTNWLFFSRARASGFTHALTTELDRVGTATYYLMSLLATAAVTFVYVILALRLSAPITLLVFVCGGGLLFWLKNRTQVVRESGEELSIATNELYAASIEHLSGMKTVKSYSAEERNADVFSKLTDRVSQVHINAVRNQAGVGFSFKVGSVVILGLILYVSLIVLALPTAGILLLLFLFARIMPQFSSLQQSYHQLLHDLPAFAAVIDMQAHCESAAEPTSAYTERVELRKAIKCSKVSFSYDQGEPRVISDLDLLIRAGETTAIVGPSGAGKSTIADLMMGLIAPDRGRVLVDDMPLTAERMRGWRDRIGYVAQDTFLFHDTILANLLWACPNASKEEMLLALRLAAADGFVSALPRGIETVVGDRGVRLSGGERQRLALARALLRKPSLLILDEATSALDSENERRIQSAIEELHGDMTILIITHRLSTIRGADTIYLVENGSVAEFGTWDELLAKENGRLRILSLGQRIDREGDLNETLNSP